MDSQEMYALAAKLFPICRSLTGDGVRETLRLLRERFLQLAIHEAPSGFQCFDWVLPDESTSSNGLSVAASCFLGDSL